MAGRCSSSRFVTSRLFPCVTFALLACGIMASPCVGQQTAALDALPSAPSPQTASTPPASGNTPSSAPGHAPAPAADNAHLTLPVGKTIPLVLTRPLNSNDVHSGDAVFAQVSTPVLVGNQVAIPAGTFVRGEVENLARNGTRGELLMRSASLVMGSAVVPLGGPVKIESEKWTAYNNPKGGTKVGMILAPLLGTGLGAAIGAATDKPHTVILGGGSMPVFPGPPLPAPQLTVTESSHKGLVIGSAVGGIVGMITSFALMAHSKQFYLEEGTPLDMTLASAVSLTGAQVADAQRNTPPVQVIRRTGPWSGPGSNPPIASPGTAAGGPASCSAGQEWCQGQCADNSAFLNDDNNCGRCGNSCGIGESCFGGSCSCAAGYTSCMGSCVSDSSFISDNNNCGSCGHSCSFGESCTGGTCMKQP